MSVPSIEMLFSRCYEECVRLQAENELLREALRDAHDAEGVCYCHVLDNQRCLVPLIDGEETQDFLGDFERDQIENLRHNDGSQEGSDGA